jgi:dTDP-4-amino-4,6-dideoxygalactose transaminase
MTPPTAPGIQRVPFNALAPGVESIRSEIDAAIARVLDSGWFLLGSELESFEREFAAYHGPDFQSVGVGSGTDALTIGLRALGVEPGDDVLMTSNAGVPPVAAIVAAGARPVFCDVDPHTHTLDPTEIDRRVTPRSRAILVVHLYGRPADMDAIVGQARQHGLKVLEDCAQAHGARYLGRVVGTFGDAAAFSFYPTKNLGALGDAGAILTSDPAIADRAKLLRMYGWRRRYVSEIHSTVSRMDELQAAVLRTKLHHLDAWNARRQWLAARYRSNLNGVIELPPTEGVFHLFVIQTDQRDALKTYLAEHGIGTDVHYPVPVHQQAPFAASAGAALPHTEKLAARVLSLPIYPELPAESVDYVSQVLGAYGA